MNHKLFYCLEKLRRTKFFVKHGTHDVDNYLAEYCRLQSENRLIAREKADGVIGDIFSSILVRFGKSCDQFRDMAQLVLQALSLKICVPVCIVPPINDGNT